MWITPTIKGRLAQTGENGVTIVEMGQNKYLRHIRLEFDMLVKCLVKNDTYILDLFLNIQEEVKTSVHFRDKTSRVRGLCFVGIEL